MRIALIAVLGLVGCGAEQYPALEPPKPVTETKTSIPKSAEDFVRMLTVEPDLIFADRCGIAGAETPGWLAMQALVNARRLDLLETALRSKNPAGRLFAAVGIRALMKNGTPVSPETQSVMKEVTSSKQIVTTCAGCIVDRKSSAKAYAEVLKLHLAGDKRKSERAMKADVSR